MEKICEFTNLYSQDNLKTWKKMDIEELKKVIGLLILLGVYQGRNEPLSSMWREKEGRELFRKSMSISRLEVILLNMRFDAKNERNISNVFAPFEEIFGMFKKNLGEAWITTNKVAIDEVSVLLWKSKV